MPTDKGKKTDRKTIIDDDYLYNDSQGRLDQSEIRIIQRHSDRILENFMQDYKRDNEAITEKIGDLETSVGKLQTEVTNLRDDVKQHSVSCPAPQIRRDLEKDCDDKQKQIDELKESTIATKNSHQTLLKFILPMISVGYVLLNFIAFFVFGSLQSATNRTTDFRIEQSMKRLEEHLVADKEAFVVLNKQLNDQKSEMEKLKDGSANLTMKLDNLIEVLKTNNMKKGTK